MLRVPQHDTHLAMMPFFVCKHFIHVLLRL